MANIKSKQFASLLTLSTASIDVVSGSFVPDAANTYDIGSSTVPWLSGSFSHIEIDGELRVAQYIKHKGDTDTLINFTDNQLRLKAGGIGFFDMEKDSSTPYSATVNPGGNRINFRVVDRNTNLLLKTDSEKFNVNLYHAGNEKLQTASTGISVTGSMILKESSTLPTAQEGGLVYSGSNFYLGFD